MITRFLQKIYYFLPFFAICIFFFLLDVKIGDTFLSVHDSPILLNKNEVHKGLIYFWNDNNFGSIFYINMISGLIPRIMSGVLLNIGVPTKWMQLFFYIFISNLILYSSWFSFNKLLIILKQKKTIVTSFIGACFYSFNLYTITFWHGGTIDGTFLVFSIAPILLLLIVTMFFEGVHLSKLVLIIFCIFFTINTGPYALALYICLFVPAILIGVKSSNNFKKNVAYILLATILSVVVSSVLIIPLGLQLFRGDVYATTNGLSNYAFSDNGISGIFRLFFEWTIDEFWAGRYFHSYFPYYDSSVSIISIFLIWISSIFALLKFRKKIKNVQVLLVAIILIAIFFAKATQYPFGTLNDLIYKFIPFFGIFRTPDTKFGLPIVLVLSFLISYSLSEFTKVWSKGVIISCVVLQIWIFFTMIPIMEIRSGDQYQRIAKIPDEYLRVASIINNDNREGRILFYPGLSYANFNFYNGFGTSGQDILGKLLDRSIVYSDGVIMSKSHEKYIELTKNFDPQILGNTSIRYVYVRNDITKIDTGEISLDKSLKKKYESKLGVLYEVPEKYIKNYITILSADNEDYLPTVEKVNPTHYKILVPKVNTQTFSIIFNSSFHPDWKLSSNSNIKISNHRLFGNYANQWDVKMNNLNTEDIHLDLYFMPQRVLYITFSISAIILSILILISYANFKKQKK